MALISEFRNTTKRKYPSLTSSLRHYKYCAAQLVKFDLTFDTVIVDEAGQATEAETYLPFTLLTRHDGHVILAGDHFYNLDHAFSHHLRRNSNYANRFLRDLWMKMSATAINFREMSWWTWCCQNCLITIGLYQAFSSYTMTCSMIHNSMKSWMTRTVLKFHYWRYYF